ncbi:MAG TPA: hypothetical protein VEK79_24550 [Thermoanaerobaculia bacterium]|nr:hypothetical protein [Thermoanaerobaculia bacterium]
MKRQLIIVFAIGLAVSPAAFADWTTTTPGQVTTTDKVGVGTHTPETGAGLGGIQEAPIHVVSSQNKNTILLIQNQTNAANVAPAIRTLADVASQNFQSHASGRTVSRFGQVLGGWNEFLSVSGSGLILGTLGGTPLVLGTGATARITILGDGKIGVGTAAPTVDFEVNGTFKATSTIGAVYQDLAEWVPATVDMKPGTVVVLNSAKNNEVMPSATSYDTAVAGVVSFKPGLLLGEGSSEKEMIATTGRVKVYVTAANGPIRVGDLLATSDKPGVAMKSQPIDIGGAKIHRPGTLIGKALEPLPAGEGEILVLLSLQ